MVNPVAISMKYSIYTNTIPTKVLSHYIDIGQHWYWYYQCFGLMHPPLMVWEKKMQSPGVDGGSWLAVDTPEGISSQ